MSKVKIFVSYKDKHKIFKSDIITPIQTGRAIADEVFEGMLGDDSGDNISEANPRYNELSAQYWVWKNYEKVGNPDYVGFMHYRRHFVFDEEFDLSDKKSWLNGAPILETDFDENCQRNLQDEKILSTLADMADCYAIKPYNVQLMQEHNSYMREHYLMTIPGAKRIVWDNFYDIVSEFYPQYKKILDEFVYGHHINCCNMFIMKKDLFFRYSEFCFRILKELDKRVDSSNFVGQEERFLGFIGEYVLTLFIMIISKENLKLKFLDAIIVRNMDSKFLRVYSLKTFLQAIFSIKKDKNHKKITILGVKIKIKNKKALKRDELKNMVYNQSKMLNMLLVKVCDLQKEIYLLKQKDSLIQEEKETALI